MAKVKSSGGGGSKFAQGGSTKMFGKQHAGPKEAGCTAQEKTGDGGKFAAGGSTRMLSKVPANTMTPGQTGR